MIHKKEFSSFREMEATTDLVKLVASLVSNAQAQNQLEKYSLRIENVVWEDTYKLERDPEFPIRLTVKFICVPILTNWPMQMRRKLPNKSA